VFAYHVYSIFKDRCKILHYGGQYKPWTKNNKTGMTELETIKMYIDQGKKQYIPIYEITQIWWRVYEG
jgi:lipopolysaccharide biosynthesis glycosyltransferase